MSDPTSASQEQLARLITGYFASQAIYVAAKLGIADLLANGPLPLKELARATETHPRSLDRLLRALASLGIFAKGDDQRVSLTPLADWLRTDRPDSQAPLALMMGGEFFQAWGHLLDSIRTGEPSFKTLHGSTYFDYLAEHSESARTFDAAMTALNDRKTLSMLEVFDFSEFPTLADLGGGNGGTLIRLLKQYPEMVGILFDLPAVVDRSDSEIKAAGLGDRCRVVGGNFLETVPEGADAYLLRHILHNWNDDQAVLILQNLRRVIGQSGRLLVVERLIEPGNGAQFGKLMDLTMLVVHGGIERTSEEFALLFEAAGFQLTRIVPTAAEVSIIVGEPVG